ncbi:MAG: hypothetical protein LBL94_10805 [Prevotellaceae bacterium]|jgi:hypothetical protein|nr:hypothetical protein [Prevotellaceae bacterium]
MMLSTKIFMAAAALTAATCSLPSAAAAQAARQADKSRTASPPKREQSNAAAGKSRTTSSPRQEQRSSSSSSSSSAAAADKSQTASLPEPEQSDKPAYAGGLLENFALGVKGGTTGIGGDLCVSLHPNIKARLGFSYLWYSYLPDGMESTVTDPRDNSEHTMGLDKIKLSFPSANLLVDFFPMRSGIFHVTLGCFFGQNKISALGHVPAGLPQFVIADYGLIPNPDGSVSADLNIGSSVKPYFGIGLGRTIPKRRVGFKFELGAVYQGKNLSLTSKNLDHSLVASTNKEMNENDIISTAKTYLQLWPVMAFTLTFRIK